MTYQESIDKLFSLHTFGIKLGLYNITSFLKKIGDPQKQLKCFHIAGSNGKGSTSSFIASILMEHRCKVGLYTSPHFVRYNERIKINGKEIPDSFVAEFISKNNEFIDEHKLTFFEVTTAIAFQWFAENKVDYAVIETGLGGRLDATNVIDPLASVITSISLEHTNILGNTIEEITAEKAGIIKKGRMVFIGRLPEESEKVIESRCNEFGSELFKISEYINEKKDSPELYTEEMEYDDWDTPLKGDYQKYNAALAALVIIKVLDEENPDIIRKGICDVIKNTGLQGRYEFFHKKPDIIFDSAHNPEGIENFLREFNKYNSEYSKKILIFGVMKDKSVKDMLRMLKNSFNDILLSSINYERALTTSELKSICNELDINAKMIDNPAEFIRDFRKNDKNTCLVVLGSMYLLGEIKTQLEHN